jgi:hypothetical protein
MRQALQRTAEHMSARVAGTDAEVLCAVSGVVSTIVLNRYRGDSHYDTVCILQGGVAIYAQA